MNPNGIHREAMSRTSAFELLVRIEKQKNQLNYLKTKDIIYISKVFMEIRRLEREGREHCSPTSSPLMGPWRVHNLKHIQKSDVYNY